MHTRGHFLLSAAKLNYINVGTWLSTCCPNYMYAETVIVLSGPINIHKAMVTNNSFPSCRICRSGQNMIGNAYVALCFRVILSNRACIRTVCRLLFERYIDTCINHSASHLGRQLLQFLLIVVLEKSSYNPNPTNLERNDIILLRENQRAY